MTRSALKASGVLLGVLLALGATAAGARAQAAKAPARPPAKAATPRPVPAAVPAPPTAPDTYSYRPEGRRDPFVSLVNRGSERGKDTRPPEGLRGVFAGDLVLKGILESRGSYMAIVQGPDAKRPYIAHAGDRLADGVIRAITADSMLILQEVNDPLSLTKQREIRKALRVVEEVK